MNILMVLPSLAKSGPVNVALEICKKLSSSNNIYILAFENGENFTSFYKSSKEIYIVENKMIAFFKLYSISKSMDIIHSHCLIPDLLTCFLSSKLSVSTVHCCLEADYKSTYGRLKGELYYRIHLFALRKIKNVVSCSKAVSSFLLSKYNLESITIENGVTIGNNKTPTDKIRYISVGVLNERKNTEVHIEAYKLLNDKNSQLTIVGDGPYFDYLQKRYSSECISFVGHVNNPRFFLSESNVFLSSSKMEGLPMALLEAMSEGLTYIVSNIDSHLEVNQLSPESGYVVENNVESFYNRMSKIDINEINYRSNLSFDLCASKFSSDVMSKSYFSTYNSIKDLYD